MTVLLVICYPLSVSAEEIEPQPETAKVTEYLKEYGEKEAKWMWGMYKWSTPNAVDNWVVFIKTLIGMGLSPQTASAIAGNVYAESSFDSGTLENGLSYDEVVSRGDRGLGYFQWTDHGRKNAFLDFAKKNGKPWTDREIQLAYFWEETLRENPTQGEWWSKKHTSYEHVYSQYRCKPYATKEEFMQDTDIERATVLFARNWERPNANVAHFDRRIGFAEDSFKVLQKFIKTNDLSTSKTVGLVNKYRNDASVEELQMAHGVKMFQDSVLMQIQADNLTDSERFVGSQIKKGIQTTSDDRQYATVSSYVSLVGWVLFGWGIIAVIIWVMAHNDSLVAQKAIKLILLNKGSPQMVGLYASIGLILVGLFILSGLFFKILIGIF